MLIPEYLCLVFLLGYILYTFLGLAYRRYVSSGQIHWLAFFGASLATTVSALSMILN